MSASSAHDPGFHAVEPGGRYRIITVAIELARGRNPSESMDGLNEHLRDLVADGKLGDYLLLGKVRGCPSRLLLAVDDDLYQGCCPNPELDKLVATIGATSSRFLAKFEPMYHLEWDAVGSADPYEGEIFSPSAAVLPLAKALADFRARAVPLEHVMVLLMSRAVDDTASAVATDDMGARVRAAAERVFKTPTVAVSMQTEEGLMHSATIMMLRGGAREDALEDEADSVYNAVCSAMHGKAVGYQVVRIVRQCDAADAQALLQAAESVVRGRALQKLAEEGALPAGVDVSRVPSRLLGQLQVPAPALVGPAP